jgi:hypothetical protein
MFLNLFRDSSDNAELMTIPVDELEFVFKAGGVENVDDILQVGRRQRLGFVCYFCSAQIVTLFNWACFLCNITAG